MNIYKEMFGYEDDMFGMDDDAAYRPNCDDITNDWDTNEGTNEETNNEDYSLESLDNLDMKAFGDQLSNDVQPYFNSMLNTLPSQDQPGEPWYGDAPVPEDDDYSAYDYQPNHLESHFAAAFGEQQQAQAQAVQQHPPPGPTRQVEQVPKQYMPTPSPANTQPIHAQENLEDSGFSETTSPQHFQPSSQQYQAHPRPVQPNILKRPIILKNVKKPLITQYRSITSNTVYPAPAKQQYAPAQVRIAPAGYRQEGAHPTQRLQTANNTQHRIISCSQGYPMRQAQPAQPRIQGNPYRSAQSLPRRQSVRQSDPERQRLHAEAKMQASEVLRYVEMRQNRELRWSFPNMVGFALLNSETGELPVADIYSFIVKHFPSYQTAPQGWKNSVRHALSKSGVFHKNETIVDGRMERRRCLWSIQQEKTNKMLAEINKQMKKGEANGQYRNQFESSYTPMTHREHPYPYKRKHAPAHSSNGGITNVAMKRPAILSRGQHITTERPISSGFGRSISINKSGRIPTQPRERSPVIDPMDMPLFTSEDDRQEEEERYDGPLRPTFDPANISLFEDSERERYSQPAADLDIPDDCAFTNFFVQSPPPAAAATAVRDDDDYKLSPSDEELLANPLGPVKREFPGNDDEDEEEPFIKKRKQEPARSIETELRDEGEKQPSTRRENTERKYFEIRNGNEELRKSLHQ
ncbi:hypothetical protein PRIPAC_77327 [Pristionchus pacificus]|uniref:Fork-head domain-containing protein n=1 Tax=Pristionchus pacificus TaxID=54126 RepID=A0A2A6BXL4_PRIPA|nr:hypothetical protein PRIPAC_77327 [Pristionchus pacificus]|eukprot:PDM70513.1 hypothetical protein PRIPAC_46759 [Pristionchus pacificus]